ncbi:type IV secretion system protein [Sphingopyxis sp.]|uniref:type IV secretion system protein n=1 Tax=Sphingopyxis sp. TaxID=1908224 RepID=UPI0035ADA0FC
MACPGLSSDNFLSAVLNAVDCQAQAIGSGGYQALAAPGSSLSLTLTGLLTLFVAFYGYRMLLGEGPSVRDGVLALAKIGIVLALATSWPAFRTLIYDVVFRAPAQLASEIGRPAHLPGAGGGLVGRLVYADQSLIALGYLGTGEAGEPPRAGAAPLQPGLAPLTPAPLSEFNELMFGGARMMFLTGSITSLTAPWLIAGLLLALGPFFIAFLLFEGTRGVFEGWLRVLGGAALGALGASIVLGVELAMIEPWLGQLIATRLAGYPTPGVAVELFAVTLIFALTLGAVLYGVGWVAYGFRLPETWRIMPQEVSGRLRAHSRQIVDSRSGSADESRTRAVAIADAAAASHRREAGRVAMAGGLAPASVALGAAQVRPGLGGDLARAAPLPLGQSQKRRTTTRSSASSGRRDRRA